jgi:hypothetical protein
MLDTTANNYIYRTSLNFCRYKIENSKSLSIRYRIPELEIGLSAYKDAHEVARYSQRVRSTHQPKIFDSGALTYNICNYINSYYAKDATASKFEIRCGNPLFMRCKIMCHHRANLLHAYC